MEDFVDFDNTCDEVDTVVYMVVQLLPCLTLATFKSPCNILDKSTATPFFRTSSPVKPHICCSDTLHTSVVC